MSTDRHEPATSPPARAATRRGRQLVEIARLVASGDRGRAAGLALEHAAEFPGDADLLARLAPADEAVSRRRP